MQAYIRFPLYLYRPESVIWNGFSKPFHLVSKWDNKLNRVGQPSEFSSIASKSPFLSAKPQWHLDGSKRRIQPVSKKVWWWSCDPFLCPRLIYKGIKGLINFFGDLSIHTNWAIKAYFLSWIGSHQFMSACIIHWRCWYRETSESNDFTIFRLA